MARIRSVHPDICESATLAAMDDASAERTFVRLWTACDDEGRAKADPRLLKAKLYPLHDAVSVDDVRRDLKMLAEHGFTVPYAVDGIDYLFVPSFPKYQHPNRPTASKLPPPPDHSLTTHGGLTEDSLRTQEGVSAGEGEETGEGVEDEDGDALQLSPSAAPGPVDDFDVVVVGYVNHFSTDDDSPGYVAGIRKTFIHEQGEKVRAQLNDGISAEDVLAGIIEQRQPKRKTDPTVTTAAAARQTIELNQQRSENPCPRCIDYAPGQIEDSDGAVLRCPVCNGLGVALEAAS